MFSHFFGHLFKVARCPPLQFAYLLGMWKHGLLLPQSRIEHWCVLAVWPSQPHRQHLSSSQPLQCLNLQHLGHTSPLPVSQYLPTLQTLPLNRSLVQSSLPTSQLSLRVTTKVDLVSIPSQILLLEASHLGEVGRQILFCNLISS